ncbi:MAG: ribonuclease Z [Eubacteriales bacterium]|nr:ribonuclease Z [Eubacteriales bacterium]
MLEVCLLGTGGMVPLPKRHLTALMVRYNGSNILIDCGEGTQVAIKKKGWSPYPIDTILFTHYHADHISGLPGLLLTLGNCDRREPLMICGPRGLRRVVDALRIISPQLPYEIIYKEYAEPMETWQRNDFHIRAFRVNHRVECYGYRIDIRRQGRFQVERAKELGLPCPLWGRLQHGETVEHEGTMYTPDMVMGEARRGLSLVYCTDTRPTDRIVEEATDTDLFICEGMYGEGEKDQNAKRYKHMTMEEAARMAAKAKPRRMWYTHYSPANMNPKQYEKGLRKIYDKIEVPKDGKSIDLKFDDEA